MIILINDGGWSWSSIRSVIMREVTKSDDRKAGVRFVNRNMKII